MIRQHEIVSALYAFLHLGRGTFTLDPHYANEVRALVKRIEAGEPIVRASDAMYETHGNGD